ncbi:hypothetical protein PENTCL1PPCAC_29973, partial [Pristionchus entomophagus]
PWSSGRHFNWQSSCSHCASLGNSSSFVDRQTFIEISGDKTEGLMSREEDEMPPQKVLVDDEEDLPDCNDVRLRGRTFSMRCADAEAVKKARQAARFVVRDLVCRKRSATNPLEDMRDPFAPIKWLRIGGPPPPPVRRLAVPRKRFSPPQQQQPPLPDSSASEADYRLHSPGKIVGNLNDPRRRRRPDTRPFPPQDFEDAEGLSFIREEEEEQEVAQERKMEETTSNQMAKTRENKDDDEDVPCLALNGVHISC